MIADGLEQLFILIATSLDSLLMDFPQSALSTSSLSPYINDSVVVLGLRYLNWFVPVGVLLGIIATWAAVVVSFSVFMVLWNNFKELR